MEEVAYAGFWRRVASVIIDIIILWVPALLFRWSAPYLGVEGIALEVIDFIYLMIIWSLYYGFLESSSRQATFGKQAMGLKVVNYEGERVSFLIAASRFLAQFVSILPLGFGIFMIGWTKKKQGIHDMLVKCVVIKISASTPNKSKHSDSVNAADV